MGLPVWLIGEHTSFCLVGLKLEAGKKIREVESYQVLKFWGQLPWRLLFDSWGGCHRDCGSEFSFYMWSGNCLFPYSVSQSLYIFFFLKLVCIGYVLLTERVLITMVKEFEGNLKMTWEVGGLDVWAKQTPEMIITILNICLLPGLYISHFI